MKKNQDKKKVAILHPDLGIGGAENLIINLALALKQKNYDVKIYTAHFDPNRCFEECKQLDIEVRGDLFPRTIFGRLIALCAYIRMLICAIYVTWFSNINYDYYVVDQVSFPIPILKTKNSKILFYCHYPDKLLSTQRQSVFMKVYRFFLDYFEEITTGMAQTIVVNSEFTQKVFLDNFPLISLDQKKDEEQQSNFLLKKHLPKVLYPAINLKTFEKTKGFNKDINNLLNQQKGQELKIFTSLNRYERKKNINLAIQAFADFLGRNHNQEGLSNYYLVIAGGWDPRVQENVDHEIELRKCAISFGVGSNVIFLKSISNDERLLLLENTQILLYTPENEHFGIVPVEAMYMKCIVIACNSGGPLESVAHQKTGFLLPSKAQEWGDVMSQLEYGQLKSKKEQIQNAAKQRVLSMFTADVFADQLDNILRQIQ